MKRRTRKIAFTAAAVIVAAAVLIIAVEGGSRRLVLTDVNTGEVYADFPVSDGTRFSVEFVHSINKTPVKDIYEVRNGSEIYVVETDYYSFGTGVQTQLNPGETLEYGDDGSMQIKNIDKLIPDLIYIVGTVSDHVMCIDESEISLRELCGKNSMVRFSIEKRLW